MKLIVLTLTLLFLILVFGLIHLLWRARREQAFFRREFWTDVVWWFFRFTIVDAAKRLIFIVPYVILALALGLDIPTIAKEGYKGFGPLSLWPGWLQGIVFVLLFDLSLYWNHRLFHKGWLWKFHAVHHGPEELDWLSSIRLHPVNEILGDAMSALPILVLGFNPMIVLPLVPLIGFYALMVHANLDWDLGLLRCVIASPVFHRWHHSKNPEAVDKNFAALFVFWDALFGTLYMPRGISPGNFGVPEKASPSFLANWPTPSAENGRTIRKIRLQRRGIVLVEPPRWIDRSEHPFSCCDDRWSPAHRKSWRRSVDPRRTLNSRSMRGFPDYFVFFVPFVDFSYGFSASPTKPVSSRIAARTATADSSDMADFARRRQWSGLGRTKRSRRAGL